MAGCFGNHPIDRWLERKLNDCLDRIDRWLERKLNDCLDRTYGDDDEEEENDNEDDDDECCPECGSSLGDDRQCTQPSKHNGGVEWVD